MIILMKFSFKSLITSVNSGTAIILAIVGFAPGLASAHIEANQAKSASNLTVGLVDYLTPLVEGQILGDAELLVFIDGLEKGQFRNLIPHHKTRYGIQFTRSAFQFHYERVQHYLDEEQGTPGTLDPAQLLIWAQSSLKKNLRVKISREESRKETQYLFHKMIFHTLDPGTFDMLTDYDYPKTVRVELTRSFDMMSTPVTQAQWSMIWGTNPSCYKGGDQSVAINIRGNSVRMQPDHPVEQVTWNEVQEFIVKLNQLSRDGDVLLNSLIPDYQVGDQYRLPTDAEWSYVVQARGKLQDQYYFGNDQILFKEYAWLRETSEFHTHAVGQLKPLVFEGKAFYDLLGNVWEFVEDRYSNRPLDLDLNTFLRDPLGPKSGVDRVIRGCAWFNFASECRSAHRDHGPSDHARPSVGFRLLRVRNP